MVDLHTHVLPGLDDGAADLAEAIAICEDAAADGIRTIVATPHVRRDYDVTPAAMRSALTGLRAAVQGIVEVLPGGEIDIDELHRPMDELLEFGLGGNPGFLLLETPYVGWRSDFDDAVERVLAAGVTPVIAHPERNSEVQANPKRLRPLVEAGALVQLTAASVDGRGSGRAQRCAATLLELRLAHVVSSDAHGPAVRRIGLSGAAAALGDPELGRWLTDGVPRAIVERRPIPPRPPGGRALRRLLRRR